MYEGLPNQCYLGILQTLYSLKQIKDVFKNLIQLNLMCYDQLIVYFVNVISSSVLVVCNLYK